MTDHWDALPHTDMTDEEVEASTADLDPTNPVHLAIAFLNALRDREVEVLEALVTPVCRASWGDFEAARSGLEAIPDWGVASRPEPAVGMPYIVYVKILPHVTKSFRVESEEIVGAAAVVTLVNLQEYGRWTVQALGQYWLPKDA